MSVKKKLVLIPSAYSYRALGDIEQFIGQYAGLLDVFVIVDELPTDKFATVSWSEEDVHFVRKGTRQATYLIATADYLVDAGAVIGATKVNVAQKRISVWHGTPYKSMFVDLGVEHVITALDYAAGIDLMVSPSEWYTERFLRRSMLYEGEVLESSIPRTDSLFLSEERKDGVRHTLGIPEGKKVLLYAPTYRERGSVELPFSLDSALASLGPDWVIVVKLHYLNDLDCSTGAGGGTKVINATDYASINHLLVVADLLVTDYSSLLFDYSLLNKPALLFQYDREKYEASRSFMFDMEDYVDPAFIVRDEGELYATLRRADSLEGNLQEVRRRFYPHQVPGAMAHLGEQLALDCEPRGMDEIVFLVNELNQIGGVHSFVTNLAREFKQKFNAKIIVIGAREFDGIKAEPYLFDSENLVDVKLSAETDRSTVRAILESTTGYIVIPQLNVHDQLKTYYRGKKSILMFHGDTKDVVTRSMYKVHLDRYNSARKDDFQRLAFITQANLEVISGHLNEGARSKAIAIANGIDFSDAEDLYLPSGEFALVSRLDEDKNPLEAIELFSDSRMNPSFRLHIYGDGALRSTMGQMIKERGLEDRILLHGFVADSRKIYSGKQGVISVSLTEGFGLTLVEGAKFGVPVYAYDSFTSCRDLVTASTGVRIEAGNRAAFVEALNVGFNREAYDASEVRERYSNEAVTAKWVELFAELDAEELARAHACVEEGGATALSDNAKKQAAGSSGPRAQASPVSKRSRSLPRKLKAVLKKLPGVEAARHSQLADVYRSCRRKHREPELPAVSIIIVYDACEIDLVQQSVKSVCACGYWNYEVLLVSYGYGDGSSFRGRGRRVRHLHETRASKAVARNWGIAEARGEYVVFLDPGDVLFSGSLKQLVACAEKYEAEIVLGKTLVQHDGASSKIWHKAIYAKSCVNRRLRRHLIVDDTIATGKLFKADFLSGTGLMFGGGADSANQGYQGYQDTVFMGQAYLTADNVGIVAKNVQKCASRMVGELAAACVSLDDVRALLAASDEVFRMQTGIARVYYGRQYVADVMMKCVKGYSRYSEVEQAELFALLRKGLALRERFLCTHLVRQPSLKLLVAAVIDNDEARFSVIAQGFCARHETVEGHPGRA